MKLGRCIKELERIYGIKQGGSGYYGNQHEESSNNYKTPKTEEDIAKEIGISIASLQNYKKLTEMIPELEELVDTEILAPTTALALVKYMSPSEQEEFVNSMDITQKITKKEVALENEKKRLEGNKLGAEITNNNKNTDTVTLQLECERNERKETWTDNQIAKKAGVVLLHSPQIIKHKEKISIWKINLQ